jgi:hypothetical protein
LSEKIKGKGGRPKGSVKYKYKKQYAAQLLEHMKVGKSFESFAAKVGCPSAVLYRFVDESKEFSDAKLRGHALALAWWEEVGRQGIIYKKDGPRVDASLWRIVMKNRFAWHDAQKIEHTVESKESKLIIDLGGPKLTEDKTKENE